MHRPPRFYQENKDEKPFKWNRSPSKDNNSNNGQERPTRENIQYIKRRHMTSLNATLTEVLTTIKGKYFVQYPSSMVSPLHTHTPLRILHAP